MADDSLADFLSEIAATEAAVAGSAADDSTPAGAIYADAVASAGAIVTPALPAAPTATSASVSSVAVKPTTLQVFPSKPKPVAAPLRRDAEDVDLLSILPFGAAAGSAARAAAGVSKFSSSFPAIPRSLMPKVAARQGPVVARSPALITGGPHVSVSSGSSAASGTFGTTAVFPDGSTAVGSKRKIPASFVRTCAGETWEDATLADWPEGDFRLFCGDLGNEVADETLAEPFRAYSSFARAKVVRDAKSHKSRGYGFVSFLEAGEALAALKELQGAYIGNRPVRLKRSTWTEKAVGEVRKKNQQRQAAAAGHGGGVR